MYLKNFENDMLPNVILDSGTIIIDLIASMEPINFQKRVVESINYREYREKSNISHMLHTQEMIFYSKV